MLRVHDFFENYPDTTDLRFNTKIANKKEFAELSRMMQFPSGLYTYQEVDRRFMTYTPYDRLLVFGQPGIGKTFIVISIFETWVNHDVPFTGNRALVVVKGAGIRENFLANIEKWYRARGYIDVDPEEYKERGFRIMLSKKIFQYYEIVTYETFAKWLEEHTDEDILKEYDHRPVFIDEIHNFRTIGVNEETKRMYRQMDRFLHLVSGKVVGLTGTPMVNAAEEIVSIMNLLLPRDRQISESTFTARKESGDLQDYLFPFFNGRISFIRQGQSRIQQHHRGEHLELEMGEETVMMATKLVLSTMSEFQYETYQRALQEEQQAFKTGPRNALNFVFPDGSLQFDKWVERSTIGGVKRYQWSETTDNVVEAWEGATIGDILHNNLDNLRVLSTKMATIVETLQQNPDEVAFVYTDNFVRGSGAIVMGLVLESMGWEFFDGSVAALPSTKKKRYALMTSETSTSRQMSNIQKVANDPRNKFGEYLHVLVGSAIVSEGISFMNVRQVHVLTAGWHYASTYQAINRAIRETSHQAFDEADSYVNIYRHAAVGEEDVFTVDVENYFVAEEKNKQIKQVERIMKQSAFDCPLNKYRNILPTDVAGTEDADYSTPDYTCLGYEETELDLTTYHMYYFELDRAKIALDIGNIVSVLRRVTLDKLQEMITAPASSVLLALDFLDSQNIKIPNRFGQSAYIKTRNGVVYWSRDASAGIHPSQFVPAITYSYPTQPVSQNIGQSDVEQFVQDARAENIVTLFQQLPASSRPPVLERVLISDVAGKDVLLQHLRYVWYVFPQSRAIVHTMNQVKFDKSHYGTNLLKFTDKKSLRVYSLEDKDPRWRNSTPNEDKRYIEYINQVIFQREMAIQEMWPIYGVVSVVDYAFRVRDTEQAKTGRAKKTGEIDERTMGSGVICTQKKKADIESYLSLYDLEATGTRQDLCQVLYDFLWENDAILFK